MPKKNMPKENMPKENFGSHFSQSHLVIWLNYGLLVRIWPKSKWPAASNFFLNVAFIDRKKVSWLEQKRILSRRFFLSAEICEGCAREKLFLFFCLLDRVMYM